MRVLSGLLGIKTIFACAVGVRRQEILPPSQGSSTKIRKTGGLVAQPVASDATNSVLPSRLPYRLPMEGAPARR